MRLQWMWPIVIAGCGTNAAASGALVLALDAAETTDAALAADTEADSAASCVIGATCQSHSDFGSCTGIITACAGGQPVCNAAIAVAETCNHKDDDCNGVTDDNLCEDGDPCTIGVCVGTDCGQKPACDDGDSCTTDACTAGTCSHTGSGCSMGGICVPAGQKDPKDACRVCNPLQSTTGYVSQKGLACDDGDLCTVGDVCVNGGCHGTAMDCGTASSCGGATCVAGKCVTSGSGGTCKPGDIAACSDPCETKVCGSDCQWQPCGLKAGAVCAWQNGTHHQCCGPGSWQFCSKTTCDWYACQADPQSGCP